MVGDTGPEGQWRQPGSTSHRRGGVEMVLKSDCLLTLSEEGLSGDSGQEVPEVSGDPEDGQEFSKVLPP